MIALSRFLDPIRERRVYFEKRQAYLVEKILMEGMDKACGAHAGQMLSSHKNTGFLGAEYTLRLIARPVFYFVVSLTKGLKSWERTFSPP